MNLYLLTTTRTQNFDQNYVQPHYDFLDKLKENNQLEAFGPFSDSTGGAYVIKCDSLDEAVKISESDPLIKSGSSTVDVKEWMVKN
ncbi:YciI family protein [Niallia sp. 01092]|uniref:YciI family protein n=1 Tax=unclassified Niallia TaxID=2837522 RepID=UPI003FD68C10